MVQASNLDTREVTTKKTINGVVHVYNQSDTPRE
jgi:hypothetical protein